MCQMLMQNRRVILYLLWILRFSCRIVFWISIVFESNTNQVFPHVNLIHVQPPKQRHLEGSITDSTLFNSRTRYFQQDLSWERGSRSSGHSWYWLVDVCCALEALTVSGCRRGQKAGVRIRELQIGMTLTRGLRPKDRATGPHGPRRCIHRSTSNWDMKKIIYHVWTLFCPIVLK